MYIYLFQLYSCVYNITSAVRKRAISRRKLIILVQCVYFQGSYIGHMYKTAHLVFITTSMFLNIFSFFFFLHPCKPSVYVLARCNCQCCFCIIKLTGPAPFQSMIKQCIHFLIIPKVSYTYTEKDTSFYDSMHFQVMEISKLSELKAVCTFNFFFFSRDITDLNKYSSMLGKIFTGVKT